MRHYPIENIPNEPDDCCFEIGCNDPRVVKSIRDGVCPLCDSPLDHSPEWLAALEIPCSSPICSFVLKPHGKLSTKQPLTELTPAAGRGYYCGERNFQ